MDSTINKEVVVITPVFEDATASARLFTELHSEFGDRVYVIAVDDGSRKEPIDASALEAASVEGVVLKLRRNVGHQRAISVGLGYAHEHGGPASRYVVMDSDGEDKPESIHTLLKPLDGGETDICVAERKSRFETARFKVFYFVYKQLFLLMTGRRITFGNFMAMKWDALARLESMQETPIHVAGAVLASKLRSSSCPIDRGPRYAGQSKMNFVGLVLHGFKALMVFAEDVLVRVGILCAFVAAMAVLGAITAIGLKLAGFSTPGWFSVALGILVLIFMQTGALALMTLMLTGVVRGGTVIPNVGHREFIEVVLHASRAGR